MAKSTVKSCFTNVTTEGLHQDAHHFTTEGEDKKTSERKETAELWNDFLQIKSE